MVSLRPYRLFHHPGGIHSGIHEIAAPAGSALAWFAQRFTHDFHAGSVRKGCRGTRPGTRYRYAFWRWCWTSSRLWFALRFAPAYARTFRANLPCEPGRPACYQKLWFPGGGFHCGLHGIAGIRCPSAEVNDHMKTTMLYTQRQPIRSQVFSGSTV